MHSIVCIEIEFTLKIKKKINNWLGNFILTF